MPSLEIAIFAFVTCATPGPVNIVATISGAQHGLKSNIPFILGATLSLSFVIFVSSFGVSQVLTTNETLANSITLVGSIYILYLAFLMLTKSIDINTESEKHSDTSFYQGSLLQVINPKAWLVSMSGLAMYLQAGKQSILFIYILMFFIACFTSVFLWTCLGRLIAAKVNHSYITVFTRLMAILLSVLVIYNLFQTFF